MSRITRILIALLVPLVLFLAWAGGQFRTTEAVIDQLSNISSEITGITQVGDALYRGVSSVDKEKAFFISTARQPSYGGPMTVAAVVDEDKRIRHAAILASSDTRSYLQKVYDLGVLSGLVDASIEEMPEVDGVSGATLSSTAITRGVEEAAWIIGSAQFGMVRHDEQPGTATPETLKLITICLFFAAAYLLAVLRFRNKNLVRGALHCCGIGVLGFWFGTQPSLATLATLLDGNWLAGMATYGSLLCLVLIIVTFLITRKNLFCTYICPFGAIQEGIGKITGCSAPVQSRWMVWVAHGWVLLVLLAAFYFQRPAYAMYGPLGMTLNFIGSGVIYGLTILVVLSSLMFKQPWCRLFCPTTILISYLRFVRRVFGTAPTAKNLQKIEDIHS